MSDQLLTTTEMLSLVCRRKKPVGRKRYYISDIEHFIDRLKPEYIITPNGKRAYLWKQNEIEIIIKEIC